MNKSINQDKQANQAEKVLSPVVLTMPRRTYEFIVLLAKSKGMTTNQLLEQKLDKFLDDEFEALKNKEA